MKTGTKIIIGVGAFLLLVTYLGYAKAKKLQAIFDKILINVTGFRNLNASLTDIRFNVDIELTNPTGEDFSVNGYFVTLTRLNFFYKGKYLATAKPQIETVLVPANNKLKISNIPVVLPTASVVAYAMEFLTFDINNLSVEAVIEVAGSEILIK